jgi:ABC-type proline/glycine betaine transport system permease subunit
MAGVNQTLMMALSMVVVASMIAVGGLGQVVLRGIGRLDMGIATVGGIGIVLLAVALDRLTQAFAAPKPRSAAGPSAQIRRRSAWPRLGAALLKRSAN